MSIVVKNLSRYFGNQAALNHVSFEINEGEIVGFIGPNGAGKSTMMKIITGILPQSEGEVYIKGKKIDEDPIEIKRIIGYLPENNPLYFNMYVKEYLSHVAGFYNIKGEKKIKEIIELTGLGREEHKIIATLSKGYKQRVGLAQALIHDPEVLILDEPTSGLDPNQIIEIRDLIKETGKNKTIILSTHIMQEVEAICQRIIIINKGEIVANGTTQEVRSIETEQITIQVEFSKAVPDALLMELMQLGNFRKIDPQNCLIQTTPEKDPREAIFKLAVKYGESVLSMQKNTMQLEEVFKQLTR